jgi:hypothetical protein
MLIKGRSVKTAPYLILASSPVSPIFIQRTWENIETWEWLGMRLPDPASITSSSIPRPYCPWRRITVVLDYLGANLGLQMSFTLQ